MLILIWSVLFQCSNHAQREYINFDIWEAGITKVGSQVLDIHQDQEGFIWLSTFNGVIRFDGLHFTELADLHPEYEHIPTGHISCVRLDGDKNIWIGTIEKGLYKVDDFGKFSSFNDDLADGEKLEEYRIEDIVFADSLLFVLGRTGLNTFQMRNGKYQKVKNIAGVSDEKIRSVLMFENDALFTTNESILSLKGTIEEKSELRFPRLFVDKKNVLWKTSISEKGTLIFKFKNKKWEEIPHQPLKNLKKSRAFSWDYEGRLWGVRYNRNLVCYDFEKRKWLVEQGKSNHNLDQKRIRDVLVDNRRCGMDWVRCDFTFQKKKRCSVDQDS